MMTIFRITTKMQNPERKHIDLYSDMDEAMGFFNGVRRNANCKSIEVTKLQNTDDCSKFDEVEVIASFSKETNYDDEKEKSTMMNTKNFANNVPENLKNTVIAIMKRFTINGWCDAMYICNTIAQYSGTGNGCGSFVSGEIKNASDIATFLQFAYGHNISKEDILELEEILRTGSLDREKTVTGIRNYIERCRQEMITCDIIRADYLGRCIDKATMTLAAM